MNSNHEKHSHVAIIGIIALVCIVGVVLGSFYYYKHHEPVERQAMAYGPAEQPEMEQPMTAEQPVMTRYVEHPTRPVEHKVTRVVEYHEPQEYAAPRRERPRERRPVNLSFNLGFQKTVTPAPRGEWCIYEENGNESCRPCPRRGAQNMRRCNPPARGGWTSNHDRVARLMNQFANQVLDRNNHAASNILERAKHAVRDMRNSGENLQATNRNGATLYSIVQEVLVSIAGRLPANLQNSLNELNSLLR